jgi:3-phenylpropionate/trans-cinnamate dioxygenase ferredoxin reductase subunit
VEWLTVSGLELNRGLVCDAYGRTLDPLVFGVGDAVCTRIGNSYRPTRQWTAVTEQARRLASTLCGEPQRGPVIDDCYFWSDQHGLRLQFIGQMPADPQLHWVKGSPEEERYVVLCCTDGKVRAVFSVGSPREFLLRSMALRRGEEAALPSA